MQHFVGKEGNKNQTLTTLGQEGEILRFSLHVKYLQIIGLPFRWFSVVDDTKNQCLSISYSVFFRRSDFDFDLIPSGTRKLNDWLPFVFLYELVGHKFKYVTSYHFHFQTCLVGWQLKVFDQTKNELPHPFRQESDGKTFQFFCNLPHYTIKCLLAIRFQTFLITSNQTWWVFSGQTSENGFWVGPFFVIVVIYPVLCLELRQLRSIFTNRWSLVNLPLVLTVFATTG